MTLATDVPQRPAGQPLTVLVCALGGEGGGVLAEWLYAAAVRAGHAAQATSIPGVAQRTGATTYYLEISREPVPRDAPQGTLVLRGAGARVDGIVFQNMRVPDGNGAGIRLEKSDLDVVNSMFRSSEEGILTADDPEATLTIDRSTFSRLGRCDRGLSCAHSVYTGLYGRVVVTHTRFEKGSGGHYLKTRAADVEIVDNSFDDTQGTATNYMIDLPSGSVGSITDNLFVQGRNKENYSAFIAVAAEDRGNPSRGLSISGNRASLPADMGRKSFFVADWSGEALAIGPNELGPGLQRFEKR